VTGARLREHAAAMPKPYDLERARAEMEDLDAAIAAIEDGPTRNQLTTLVEAADVRKILEGVFGNSSFLTRIIRQHPDWLPRLIDAVPETTFETLIEHTAASVHSTSQVELMKRLRLAKSEAALLIALADLTGCWPLEKVTHALSDFADFAVSVWRVASSARTAFVAASASLRPVLTRVSSCSRPAICAACFSSNSVDIGTSTGWVHPPGPRHLALNSRPRATPKGAALVAPG